MGQVKLWTTEEDKIVVEYASQGKLSRECADALGRNRSSVLGRASRLKVSFRREKVVQVDKPNRAVSWVANNNIKITDKRAFRFFSNIPKPTVAPRYEQPEAASTPYGKPRSLINLEEHHCRWPCFESPKSGRQMFCCADRMAGKPYCVEHQALVYVKKYFAEAVI